MVSVPPLGVGGDRHLEGNRRPCGGHGQGGGGVYVYTELVNVMPSIAQVIAYRTLPAVGAVGDGGRSPWARPA